MNNELTLATRSFSHAAACGRAVLTAFPGTPVAVLPVREGEWELRTGSLADPAWGWPSLEQRTRTVNLLAKYQKLENAR